MERRDVGNLKFFFSWSYNTQIAIESISLIRRL